MSYNLIELLKSSDTHNKWDDIAVSLRNGLKEPGDKINQISNGLMLINNYLNRNGRQLNTREKPIEYIKMICKQKNLSYSETPRNGLTCLELSGECFRVVIVMQDSRLMQSSLKSDFIKQVLIEYNKEKPTSCPELQKSLSDGDYSFLLIHIEELLQLYSVGNDRTQQLKAFLCLQSLEEDINKLSQCNVIPRLQPDLSLPVPQPTNIIGVIKPRSGGIPSQFIFYLPKTDSNNDSRCYTDGDRFNIMVQLMPHNEHNLLPFIPLVNLQKDAKGNCIPSYVTADSLKCVSLAAKFVLKLSRPLVISETNMSAITSITGLNLITARERNNYVDLLLDEAGSPLTYQDRFYSMLPNESQVAFQILNETVPVMAHVVTSVPFLLPSQLPKIVAILKKQAIINVMMESFLLSNTKEDFERDCIGAQPVNIMMVSHDALICSFTQSNPDGFRIKFSITYNECGQSIVKLLSQPEYQSIECPQKVTQKYNNLPMVIFWLLYKYGGLTMRESASFIPDSVSLSDKPPTDFQEKVNDFQFLKQCIQSAKDNLNIRSENDKEIFPKIKIEPKLELLTTTLQQQIVNSPSIMSHYDIPSSAASKLSSAIQNAVHEPGLMQCQEFQNTFQNQYLQHSNNCHMPGQNNNLNSLNNPMSVNSLNCGQSSSQSNNQSVKQEQYQPYTGHGNKHMSLDQMLSSDFAMPFASDGIGQFNSMAHSMHYSEHSNGAPNINNVYGGHVGNFKDSPNSKNARPLDSQSSVLVNLLNCNENSSSGNSNLMSRQLSNNLIPQCFPPNNYINNDQMDPSKNPIQSQMLRGSQQIPRMRMPHPNQPPKQNLGPNYNPNPVPSLPINRSPSSTKSDIMMMPYPQDTGTVRGVSIRKPRKRRAPNLELNQRLPKLQTPQFPMIQQQTPSDSMHMPNMQMNHLQQTSVSIGNPSQSSSSNVSFSSPTTVDQSVYDFDDNVEFSRIRTVSSNSSISPHSMNPNNLSRRVSGSGSKKPLKVKISRKIISQNPTIDSQLDSQMSNSYESEQKMKEKASMCRSNTMPNISNIILSAPSSTSSVNTVIGITTATTGVTHSRPTAIMSAIDSPLTCSSMSSMQASPYGSVNIGSQHNLSAVLESNCDGTEIKKRRKRKIKPEQGDEADIALKREKMEARKQNKKKKELGSISGMSSHGSMDNLSGLMNDSNLKPPLPIKLSVNAKMGSVSSSTVRNPKLSIANSSPASGTLNSQNSVGSMVKQSSKDLKMASSGGSVAEPILRNYKIPKKKSSDNNHQGNMFQESMQSSTKPSSMDYSQKLSKDQPDISKSEMSMSGFGDRVKSPEMSVNLNSFGQSQSLNNDQDSKSINESQSSVSTPKVKNIHDIVDRLLAKTSGITMSNAESIINSNSIPSGDVVPQMKFSEHGQNSQENIFEKFSSSKSKSDHRQIPTSRFPDPSMNIPRYPYQRPQNTYQPRGPVAPTSFTYGVRQPFVTGGNNSNAVYRMDSAPPRNFPPVNQTNPPPGSQYHKKPSNPSAIQNRKK